MKKVIILYNMPYLRANYGINFLFTAYVTNIFIKHTHKYYCLLAKNEIDFI